MKKLISCILLSLFFGLSLQAQIKIPQGTYIQVAFAQELTSKQTTETTAYVVSPLIINGVTLIEKGTPVMAQVYNHKAKALGREGSIQIQFLSTQSKDGQTIYFFNNKKEVIGDSRAGLAYGLGIGLGVFFFPCFACLAIKGEEATIPANMTFTVSTLNDYVIPQ